MNHEIFKRMRNITLLWQQEEWPPLLHLILRIMKHASKQPDSDAITYTSSSKVTSHFQVTGTEPHRQLDGLLLEVM